MSIPLPLQTNLPSVTHLIGGSVVQLCIGLLFAGITYSQAYSYSLMAASDPLLIKVTVILIVLLETISSVFSIHIVYFLLVENFGNFAILDLIAWSEKGASITVSTTILLAHIFSIWRIYHLTRRNWLITITIGIVAVINFVTDIFLNVSYIVLADSWSHLLASQAANVMFIITSGITAAEDIAIAAVLIYCLTRMRTGFKRTDHTITVMIAYVVNTGAMTALMSLLLLFTYCFMKDTYMFLGAYFLAGRAYGIAVIGTLNQRCYFRDTEPAIVTDGDMPLSRIMRSTEDEPRRHIEIFKNIVRQSDDTGTVDGVSDTKSVVSSSLSFA